jgi:mono/diheme cytochrome c family protein
MGRLRLTPTQWVLLGIFLVLSGLQLAMQPAADRPGWVFMPEMWFSPAARPEGRHPELAAGMVQQVAPPGTVARETPVLPLGEAGQPPPPGLTNPLAGRADTQAAGRQVFNTFCIPCHGPRGQGDGLVVSRGFPAPPSLTAETAKGLSDAAIFQLLTLGRNNMPPYRFQLSRLQRWQVIDYVRELQRGPTPVSGGEPAALGTDPNAGGEALTGERR